MILERNQPLVIAKELVDCRDDIPAHDNNYVEAYVTQELSVGLLTTSVSCPDPESQHCESLATLSLLAVEHTQTTWNPIGIYRVKIKQND